MPKTTLLWLLAVSVSCFAQSAISINHGTGNPAPIYPRVVAQVVLKGQTAAIPTTTIFTPKSDGLYRISAYGVTTVPAPGNNGAWEVNFGWTDDAGAEQNNLSNESEFPPVLNIFAYATPPGGASTLTFVAEDNAGMPLTYSVAPSQPPYQNPTSTYALFITVEQLM
jgi:hypothetical protein